MMETKRIQTQHPQGKPGVNIERDKYDTMRVAILQALKGQGAQVFKALTETVKARLQGEFDGSVSWYLTTVKLDLEARGEIKCTRKSGGQVIELA